MNKVSQVSSVRVFVQASLYTILPSPEISPQSLQTRPKLMLYWMLLNNSLNYAYYEFSIKWSK